MALVIPTASSLFPSAAWWQALANSINSEMAQLRSESIGASILTSGTNVDTVTASSTWTTWANSNPNTPETGTGILRTWWVTDTSGAQLWMSATNTGAVYLRFRGSGGWSAWKRIDAQYAIDQAKAYTDTAVLGARGGSGSGTKLVPLALTVGGSAAASSLGAVGVRMPMQWGARVTRWRVHVRNINPRFGTNQPGAVSLTGLWFGQGDGSGSFSGAATQINGAVSTPADGSEWVSKWVTTPLEAGTRYLLAYGLNTTGTQSVVGGGWTTASPADAANNAAAKTARTALPLDVWIEAETAATTPVIAAWGDSLSSGVGATLPVYDSVVSQYARANGALPVHYTASGDSAASWAGNLSAYKWTRWAALAKPDVTIAAMGSNDVFNGDSLATIQGNWQAAVDNIRATISPAVVVTTITPRDGVTGAQEDARRSLNAWLKGLPRGRDVFDLVPAVSSDDETLTPALTSDGIHLNTAGYAAEVGTITRALAFAPSAGPQGPKGDKGDKGDPGGSDAATASWISSGTETQAALDARLDSGNTPAALKARLPVNVRDYGTKGDGTTDDTTAVTNAVAAAKTAGRPLHWPEGTYLTTASIPDLHKVRHTGTGAIKRAALTFYPQPGYSQSNALHVATTGSATADGLSPTEPMALLSNAFSALTNYGPVLQGNWTINLAAGTYNDQAITGMESLNRVWIKGAPVGTGNTPTTIFDPGASGFTKALGGNNNLLLGLQDIKVQNYKTANIPAIDFSTHCDIWMTNVWGSGNDIGYRIINQSKYRMDGCVWENNTQYGGLELFGVVRDFKGAATPSIFRGNGKVGLKAKELCTGHLDDTEIYDNKHGIHFSRSCTANGTNCKIYRNQYGVTLRNQSSFVPLNVDWKFGTADINTVTPWDVEGSSSFVTNENEAISPTVFSGRGEKLLGSFAPDPAYALTGSTTATTFCTFGNLRRGSLARPGGYVRAVIVGSKGGTTGTVTIDFRFGGSSAGTIVLPATAVVFKIEVLVFSRGPGKQTVLATESLTGAAPQRVDRTYDVTLSDYLMSARATLASASDSLTVNGAWCYTTEALADEG